MTNEQRQEHLLLSHLSYSGRKLDAWTVRNAPSDILLDYHQDLHKDGQELIQEHTHLEGEF